MGKRYKYLVNKKEVHVDNLSIDDLVILYKQYYDVNDKYPTATDCKYTNNLPSDDRIVKILKSNNSDKYQFYNMLGMKYHFPNDEKYYQTFLDIFISESNKKGEPLTCDDLIQNDFGIPDGRWFVNHCPDKKVRNYNQFIEWCGLKPRYEISKDKAIEIILDMQSKLDRPLMKVDFKNPKQNEVGLGILKRYWGGINGMKKELGLTIVGKNLRELSKPVEQMEIDLKILCQKIKSEENRIVITKQDIDKCEFTMSFCTYVKVFHEQLKTTVRDYLTSIGFELCKAGNGLIHYYEDGEVTRSQYEFDFSNYLRKLNLKYNKDYYRDVRYKTFIKDYKGLVDCDYVVNYNNRLIYIEIAGMLRDYKGWFLLNKSLDSKSKEKYRLKLREKENLLKSEGLEYYILFPSDLKEETYNKIFGWYKEVKNIAERDIQASNY